MAFETCKSPRREPSRSRFLPWRRRQHQENTFCWPGPYSIEYPVIQGPIRSDRKCADHVEPFENIPMSCRRALIPIAAVARAWATMASEQVEQGGTPGPSSRLKVWLEGNPVLTDAVHSAITFVEYVPSRDYADLCIRLTATGDTAEPGHCDVSFIGLGRFAGIEAAAHADLTAVVDRTSELSPSANSQRDDERLRMPSFGTRP
jgi:hypothetical protein